LGPRDLGLPSSAKMVPGGVNLERDSRAVGRELGQMDRGLAVVGGLMPLAES